MYSAAACSSEIAINSQRPVELILSEHPHSGVFHNWVTAWTYYSIYCQYWYYHQFTAYLMFYLSLAMISSISGALAAVCAQVPQVLMCEKWDSILFLWVCNFWMISKKFPEKERCNLVLITQKIETIFNRCACNEWIIINRRVTEGVFQSVRSRPAEHAKISNLSTCNSTCKEN